MGYIDIERDKAMFTEIEKITVIEQATRQIVEAIAVGDLKQGARLPSERELSERLNVSRPVVREAMSALSALGVVTRHGAKGTFIAEKLNESIISNSLRHLIVQEWAVAREFIEARRGIESELFFLAALRRSSRDLEEIAGALAAFETLELASPEWLEADYFFHSRIGEAAHNSVLHALQISIREKVLETLKIAYSRPVEAERPNREHAEMFSAIKNQDAKQARKIAIAHIDSLNMAMESYLKKKSAELSALR